MRRLIFWATIASGAIAAYLMFRRGESFEAIINKTTSNPVRALASEITHS